MSNCRLIQANAGFNQTICNSSTVRLTGNKHSCARGKWSLVSGTGTILNPNSSITDVIDISDGTSVFKYTLTSNICDDVSEDLVTIHKVCRIDLALTSPTSNSQTAHGITTFDVILYVDELNGITVPAQDFLIYFGKSSRISVAYDNTLTTLGGYDVNNSDWAYISNITNHIWRYNPSLPGYGGTKIGFRVTYDPQGGGGFTSITISLFSTILESTTINNSKTIVITFFAT